MIKPIYLLLLILFISCNNEDATKVIPDTQIAKEELILDQSEGKWYYQKVPFSGYAIVKYPNQQLEERYGFYEGKKEGLAQKWFSDGLLKKEAYYKANRLDGVVRIWSKNPNSVLTSEANYANGERHGFQTKWYLNGQMYKRAQVNFGKEEGLQQAWRENGKLYINYEARNGRSFGLKKANLCYEVENEEIDF